MIEEKHDIIQELLTQLDDNIDIFYEENEHYVIVRNVFFTNKFYKTYNKLHQPFLFNSQNQVNFMDDVDDVITLLISCLFYTDEKINNEILNKLLNIYSDDFILNIYDVTKKL